MRNRIDVIGRDGSVRMQVVEVVIRAGGAVVQQRTLCEIDVPRDVPCDAVVRLDSELRDFWGVPSWR